MKLKHAQQPAAEEEFRAQEQNQSTKRVWQVKANIKTKERTSKILQFSAQYSRDCGIFCIESIYSNKDRVTGTSFGEGGIRPPDFGKYVCQCIDEILHLLYVTKLAKVCLPGKN